MELFIESLFSPHFPYKVSGANPQHYYKVQDEHTIFFWYVSTFSYFGIYTFTSVSYTFKAQFI